MTSVRRHRSASCSLLLAVQFQHQQEDARRGCRPRYMCAGEMAQSSTIFTYELGGAARWGAACWSRWTGTAGQVHDQPPPSTSLHARRFLLVASFRGRTPPSSATLGAAAFLGGEDSRGTERLAARRGVASGRRRGRSLPAAMLVDLGRRTLIRRLREAQGVDGISFTVHPQDGKPNTVRP